MIADYQHFSSEEFRARNRRAIELGMDWDIGEDRKLGFQTPSEIDEDDSGADCGERIESTIKLDVD